jgi:glycosyltransferase involved in cell wall biosynthesis
MKSITPKYSIILPIYNGLKYLHTCINTVTSQDYENYELIIVDDCSKDGTREYLSMLDNMRIKIIYQKENLGAIGNFSNAIKYASGEWLMFLGVDDGLQSYFFELADRLTDLCDREGLRVIASSRAHFFWEGAAKLRGDKAVQYTARKEFSILNSRKEIYLALVGAQAYFELPQMYCNSLFHRTLIEEAIDKQGGNLFSTIPPDANLAAIALSLESSYLKSFIPLGWVGTSSSRTEYPGKDSDENGFISEGITYTPSVGKPALGSLCIYFWNALLSTNSLRHESYNRFLDSRLFKVMLFSSAHAELRKRNVLNERQSLFNDVLAYNKISPSLVAALSYPLGAISYYLSYQRRVINKIKNNFMHSYQIKRKRFDGICMLKESQELDSKLSKVLGRCK